MPHWQILEVALRIAVGVVLLFSPRSAHADWTTHITCPPGRNYHDDRPDAGRIEWCELQLAGGLSVQDGPYRSWFSDGHPGEEGNYAKGRKVGAWKECNRFDRCTSARYDAVNEDERRWGVTKAEIPVRYSSGKYLVDFAACWSTWVTAKTATSSAELNIGRNPFRCNVTYIPAESKKPPYKGTYLCRVPASIGVVQLYSLDLIRELPRLGLPQFCRRDDEHRGEPLFVQKSMPFIDGLTHKEQNGWFDVATTIDAECVTISQKQGSPDTVTVRFNSYAERLVRDAVADGATRAFMCWAPSELLSTADAVDGRRLFTYSITGRGDPNRYLRCLKTGFSVPKCL